METAKHKFTHLNVIEPMDAEQLRTLNTGSLLKRLQALRHKQDCFEVSDWTEEERDTVQAAGLIAFKNSNIWRIAFSEVKTELSLREHRPRGSKEKRQEAARKKQNR